VLAQKGGEKDGGAHQLPQVIVRDPAAWLRSVFCDRRGSGWRDHNEDCPWQEFVKIIKPYRTKHFEDFVDSIVTKEAGIVGWLFGCYTPPQVELVRFGEDQHKYLKKLGCHPEREMPVNVTGNLPELTGDIRMAVWDAEMRTYGKLGFFWNGSYLKYWRGK
jgi:hypothetical protein